MDYEFITDPIGRHIAHCSMGHEALGNWLTSELGRNAPLIEGLFDAIQRIQRRQSWKYELEGSEFSLQLSPEEAVVKAHALFDSEDELTDDMNYYDSESVAHCGLNDFEALLIAWCQFVGCSPSVSTV
jgi:hypothetical protein